MCSIKTCLKLNKPFPSTKINLIDLNNLKIGSKCFTFDHILVDDTIRLYDKIVIEYTDSLFDGSNSTFFTYGSINSGKSRTIGSSFFTNPEGFISRVLVEVFTRIDEEQHLIDKSNYSVKLNLLEIKDGKVFDLIYPTQVKTFEDTVRLVQSTPRFQSPSHVVFTITLKLNESRESKFSFIDLLGTISHNEKGVKTEPHVSWDLMLLKEYLYQRLEPFEPNKGLEDNALVRMFNKCLSASKVLFIACVNFDDLEESFSTIQFSSRFTHVEFKKGLDDTIEWTPVIEQRREQSQEKVKIEESNEIESDYVTPFVRAKPTRYVDSVELFMKKYRKENSEKEFKVPETPLLNIEELDKSLYELSEEDEQDKKRKHQDQDHERLKKRFCSIKTQICKLMQDFSTEFELF